VLLAIDVRNTHTAVGLIAGSGSHAKVVHNWRIRTEPEVTADELALTIEGLIGDDSERLTGVTGLSTVPSVLHEVRVMLDQYWAGVPHVLIEPGIRTGIPLLVDNPKEVMDGIYDFIGVEQFDHDFSNLQKIEMDNDTAISHPPDFHAVRKQLGKTSPKVEDVLSDYVLTKYSSVNFWI
jgi:hypothetical protein